MPSATFKVILKSFFFQEVFLALEPTVTSL